MLITLIQKKPGGWQKVDEYYKWMVPLPDELKEDAAREGRRIGHIKRLHTDCPGCGKILTRAVIRYQHNCPGTLTDHPVKPKRARVTTKEEVERLLDKHIQNSSPTTIVTISE